MRYDLEHSKLMESKFRALDYTNTCTVMNTSVQISSTDETILKSRIVLQISLRLKCERTDGCFSHSYINDIHIIFRSLFL